MADESKGQDVVIEDLTAEQLVVKFNKKAEDAANLEYQRRVNIWLGKISDKQVAIAGHKKEIEILEENIGKNREKITEITAERVLPSPVTL